MPNKIITSFGSAFITPQDSLYREAEELGGIIASKGWTVCSGGYYGSMEAISKGAKSTGGKTIGVTVKDWQAKPNDFVDEVVIMPNLMERIVELIALADAYIVFKGGTGTLLEISATLEMMNKKAIPEKLMIFYTDFWKGLILTLKSDSDTLSVSIEHNIKFISKPEDLKALI
ncbi:MAG: LOG family protein [Ignavibacteria bacterium]|nr:LOG family protein [Ignavibacteria bacterium]